MIRCNAGNESRVHDKHASFGLVIPDMPKVTTELALPSSANQSDEPCYSDKCIPRYTGRYICTYSVRALRRGVERGLIEYVVIKSIGLDASAETKDRHE